MPPEFPRLIALAGQAGAGKTTAACHIVATYPGFTRLSFADPIRDMLKALGLTAFDLQDHKHQSHFLIGGHTPRFAMQTLGTEWGRRLIHPDIWVNALRHRIEAAWDLGYRVVIDDCRFDNEARTIRSLGGQVIALAKPGQPPPMAHASEAGVSSDLINHHLPAADVRELHTGITAHLNGFAPY